jgi:uncharacterized membrane protein
MKVKELVVNALFIAIVFVATRYISVTNGIGYFHAGDGIIMAIAIVYGTRSGIIAGAIGMGLSDALSPYIVYTIPTIIVKTLMVLVLVFIYKKLLKEKHQYIATSIAGLVGVVGYFIFEFFYYGYATAAPMVIPNLLQASVVASAIALVLVPLLKRVK